MESGTGRGSKIPGIVVCGKTGTVENYANIKGQLVKQPNHSFFVPLRQERIQELPLCVWWKTADGLEVLMLVLL